MPDRLTRPFAACLLILALALFSCEERAKPPPPIPKEKLTVLATVYPLANLAEVVGGEHVSVEWLAESGQPIPGENVPDDVRSRARLYDLLVSTGQSWATEGYDDPVRVHRIVRLDSLESARDSATPLGLLWLDPAVARDAAEEIHRRLSAQRPEAEPYFRARTDGFLRDLDDLVKSYSETLGTRPPRRVLVLSNDWLRLLRRFEIEPIMPVESSPSTLTAVQIRRITDAAKSNRLTAMLVHADTPPVVSRDLRDRTDLTILSLDALGSSAAGGRTTYLDLFRFNFDQLNQAASRAN